MQSRPFREAVRKAVEPVSVNGIDEVRFEHATLATPVRVKDEDLSGLDVPPEQDEELLDQVHEHESSLVSVAFAEGPGASRRLDCGAPRRNAVASVKAEVADVDGPTTDVAEDSDGKVPTSRYESLYASGGFGYDAQRMLWMAWAWRHYVKMFRLGPLVPGLGHRPTLLDIPCGDGFWTSVMAHLGFDAQGIDLSSTGVATAKERYPKLNFQKGNAEKTLPVPERSFDVVFSRSITHLHHPDLTAQGTLRMAHNLMRYVKDDGQLLVSYYTKRDGGGTERHHYHPVSDLVRLFEQAGDVWRVDVAGNHVQMGIRHRGWPPPPERGELLAKKALAIRNRFRASRAISRQV